MQEEEVLGKAYDGRLMRRLLRYLKLYRWHVAFAIILGMVVSAMEAIRPLFTKIAVDENIKNGDKDGLLTTILFFFLLMVVRGVLQYANAYLTQWIGQRAIYDLRMQVYGHLMKMPLRFYDKNPIGRLVTRTTNDVEVLNEMFSSGIVMVFSDVFTIVGILYFMFTMNWQMALISLSVIPVLVYGTMLFRKKAREAYREVRLQIARISSFMQEHISGIIVDQLFGREKRSFEKFSAINAAHRDANIRSVFAYAVYYPSIDIIASVAIGLVIWYAGASALEGTVTIGTLMAFLQYNEMFWRPIRDLSEKYNILQSAMASSERIFKLLDEPVPEMYRHRVFALGAKEMGEGYHPASADGGIAGKIEFKDVWFAYNDGDYVLKNVSFTVPAGTSVALVGHTGAGKTSIISILSRFYDIQKGKILLDGVNIADVAAERVRDHIGVVLQDVFLFSGTVKENISLGNPAISDERIIEAARLVGADRFISRLPKGYDGEVKERGATFSVGQKQLLSFARALAYDPRILILDEATSNIDTETEQLIQSAIKTLLTGRTSIVIAHRLSTIKNADRIIVLHKGEVREMGTHQELLALGGLYSKLYRLQYKDQETVVSSS